MSRVAPPRLARWLIRMAAPESLRDQIDGDLLEGYRRRRARRGAWRSRLWYWRQLVSIDVVRLRRAHPTPATTIIHRGPMRLANLGADVRYALRSLRTSPGFAATVLTTLAVGIGATTAIFSVAYAVLLRPLPYPDPGRLAMVYRTVPRLGLARSVASFPDFADWRSQSRRFAALGAYGSGRATYLGPEGAEEWSGVRVTADLFSVLGVAPSLGRIFTASDDVPGAEPVIILSHAHWLGRFGGDSTLMGRVIRVDGNPVTVVGVMPPNFQFPSPSTQYWVPLRGDAGRMERDTNFLTVIGRLGPGVAVADAQVEIASLAAGIDATAPGANDGYGIFVEAHHASLVRNARTSLLVFLGAVGLVLVVACGNVANLILARGTTRHREMAVRAALGAGRGRLVRQLLTESGVIALVGGVAGVALAAGLLRVLVSLGTGQIPRLPEVGLHPTVLAFAAITALGSGMVCGVMPAFLAARTAVGDALRETGPSGLGRWGRRLQRGAVVAQLAVALVLSVGAALLLNSFAELAGVHPGFDPERVIAARVAQPEPEMSEADMTESMQEMMQRLMRGRQQFYDDLETAARAIPGVSRVGLAFGLPLARYGFSRYMVPEGADIEIGQEGAIAGNIVHGDYFGALNIALRRGRLFEEGDGDGAPPVLIVNEALANLFWPGDDPIGRRVYLGEDRDTEATVIGVVADVRRRSLDEDLRPAYYRPFAQVSWPDGMFVVLQTDTPPDEVVASLRRAVWSLDPTIPLTNVTIGAELIDESLSTPRFRTLVIGTFGLAALILAVVGIYGVIAYSVGDRTREIGLRIALGAERRSILGMVMRTGLALATVGVVLGVAGALALTRFLEGMLYGLTPHDPVTFVGATALLFGISAVACYLPARRATRVDPLESLRA